MEVLFSILLFPDSQNSERFLRDKEEGGEPRATQPDFGTWHLLFPRMAEHPGFSPLLLVSTRLLTCPLHSGSRVGELRGEFMGRFREEWEPPEVVYKTKYVVFSPGKAVVVLTGSKTLRTNIGATSS